MNSLFCLGHPYHPTPSTHVFTYLYTHTFDRHLLVLSIMYLAYNFMYLYLARSFLHRYMFCVFYILPCFYLSCALYIIFIILRKTSQHTICTLHTATLHIFHTSFSTSITHTPSHCACAVYIPGPSRISLKEVGEGTVVGHSTTVLGVSSRPHTVMHES